MMFGFAVVVQQDMETGMSAWDAIRGRRLLLPVPISVWAIGGWLYRTGMRAPVDGA